MGPCVTMIKFNAGQRAAGNSGVRSWSSAYPVTWTPISKLQLLASSVAVSTKPNVGLSMYPIAQGSRVLNQFF